MTLDAENEAARADSSVELADARARIASLERLIRAEREQYRVEQERHAATIARLRAKGANSQELVRAKAEIKELARYKRMVERLQRSPLFSPAHRVWLRSRLIRGYDQKVQL